MNHPKPSIPTDILNSARAIYEQLGRGSATDEITIAAALMAERERCLKHVEGVRVDPAWSGQHADWVCGAITATIRND